MIQPILSILIPTVVGREEQFIFLRRRFDLQIFKLGYNGDVEVIQLKDNKEMTIGEKRERLYQMANGLYSVQWDDDDGVSDNAIELILNAIKSNPEVHCITFQEKCLMNGEYKRSNHSLRYSQWADNTDGYDYVRSPFYKDVIRTDIAKSVPFPKIRYNEDEQWSMALYPHLSTETHIDEELYIYIYEPKDTHETRYGLDRQ
jgi:hypothetical protein